MVQRAANISLTGGSVAAKILDPLPDKAHVWPPLELAVEVVGWDETFQRDGDQLVEAAGRGLAERRSTPDRKVARHRR
ncbi:MAG: hypothetical protein M3Q03_20775 [Chloroflexota bacterium]|nr:hypothetical protein [Chloroflexota bacterium]